LVILLFCTVIGLPLSYRHIYTFPHSIGSSSDYPFGIFKLFLQLKGVNSKRT
jgi:hypothetical protein